MMFKHLFFLANFIIAFNGGFCQSEGFKMNDNIIHKKFDEVCFPTTHNSFNYLIGPKQFIYPNQRYDIPRQLEDGIRAFMIDIHYFNGLNPVKRKDKNIYVFHQFALLGYQPISEVLDYFLDFLSSHPKEIITIIFDCSVYDSETMGKVFTSHSIYSYLYHQSNSKTWPTIDSMLAKNQRLVVFSQCSGYSDWYLKQDDYCFENNYENYSSADYKCEIIRGETTNSIFIMNHFLYGALKRKKMNANTNQYQSMMSHSLFCQKKVNHIPNFLSVDWYDKGDLFRVVNELNQNK